MSTSKRPTVLSIAGFDPCGGAGLLADIKTFEMQLVLGMGISTSITFQNESRFEGVHWLSISDIKKQLEVLFQKHSFEYVKIGLVKSLEELEEIIDFVLLNNKTTKIIWDPILKASAGFVFHEKINLEKLHSLLSKLYLITPNTEEAFKMGAQSSAFENAKVLRQYCNVLLKGGHGDSETTEDILLTSENTYFFASPRIKNGEKHGSGCILSAALTACLAKGFPLELSCEKAKKYTETVLSSTPELLGYHLT